MALTDKLTAIADAIRGKTGGTEGMTLDVMVSAIEGIESGGGFPGVAVIKGTYTHASDTYRLYIEHNIGELRPFLFYMKAKTTDLREHGKAKGIYRVACGVPTLSADEVTYLVDGVETTGKATEGTCFFFADLCDGAQLTSRGNPIFLDESTTTSSNYTVRMWPNGFNCGLYRDLMPKYEYEYTLIYGDLSGGLA